MSEYAFVYQPQIIRETAEGLNRLDIRDEMLDQRELELMTSVDAESCAVVIRGLLIGAGAGGSALSVKARADDLMRIRDITAGVIARHSGMSVERVFELTASDTYFEAEEAVDAGLADRVITRL